MLYRCFLFQDLPADVAREYPFSNQDPRAFLAYYDRSCFDGFFSSAANWRPSPKNPKANERGPKATEDSGGGEMSRHQKVWLTTLQHFLWSRSKGRFDSS